MAEFLKQFVIFYTDLVLIGGIGMLIGLVMMLVAVMLKPFD